MDGPEFLLVVITAPGNIPAEVQVLEGLLEEGLGRLHLRKPDGAVEALLERLAPRWASRLVVHGSAELAQHYGVGQVHEAAKWPEGGGKWSTSVHSWDELMRLPKGLEYAFISPVFDSISKPGYPAGQGIFEMPPGPYPCMPVGLGGISGDNIGLMARRGWKGAALLGWIWEAPQEAVGRFKQIKKIIDG